MLAVFFFKPSDGKVGLWWDIFLIKRMLFSDKVFVFPLQNYSQTKNPEKEIKVFLCESCPNEWESPHLIISLHLGIQPFSAGI